VIETPCPQSATAQQRLWVDRSVGPVYDAVVVGQHAAHRSTGLARTTLKRKEPHNIAAVAQDGHLHVLPHGTDGAGELGMKERVGQRRVGALDLQPRGGQLARELFAANQVGREHERPLR